MKFLEFLKKIPIDLGQGYLKNVTKGKLIAMSLVPKVREKKVALDVGYREGIQSECLKKKGYEVISIDIDIEKAYDDCLVMDANKKLEFGDNSFDLIWCSEVIEHLGNPKFSINEFRRILKPKGRMVLTTPNSYCWVFKALYLFGLTPKRIQNPDHKHFFCIEDIKKLFPRAEIYGFFPYFLFKFRIKKRVASLSPTFVIFEKND